MQKRAFLFRVPVVPDAVCDCFGQLKIEVQITGLVKPYIVKYIASAYILSPLTLMVIGNVFFTTCNPCIRVS